VVSGLFEGDEESWKGCRVGSAREKREFLGKNSWFFGFYFWFGYPFASDATF